MKPERLAEIKADCEAARDLAVGAPPNSYAAAYRDGCSVVPELIEALEEARALCRRLAEFSRCTNHCARIRNGVVMPGESPPDCDCGYKDLLADARNLLRDATD